MIQTVWGELFWNILVALIWETGPKINIVTWKVKLGGVVGFDILEVGVGTRVDIQLVVLKHTKNISKLVFAQKLTLHLKKCILFCLLF